MKLLGLSGGEDKSKKYSHPWIGRICMIRTYSAGVHFGELVSKEGETIVLKNAKRVHYWAKACSLSQLAMEGDKDMSGSRISMQVDEIELNGCIETIPMTDEAYNILCSKTWKS